MSRSSYEKHKLMAIGAVRALLPGTDHKVAVRGDYFEASYTRQNESFCATIGGTELSALAELLTFNAPRSIRPDRAREMAKGFLEEDARLLAKRKDDFR